MPEKITIAKGDGIGPEIMDATLKILEASSANLEFEEIKVGKEVFESGVPSGIPDHAWSTLRNNRVFLKAPITTPQGGGYKSLNVTMRKTLGLFANIRPCEAFTPYVESKHQEMDLVIVRENEEDLYTGIEHQQTNETVQSLKLISKPGSEAIVRYAFEYAKAHDRKKVTCMTKDNIMKQTDGTFHKIFMEVAKEYPGIEADHKIIDIGAALLADQPDAFDVIVSMNLYGDILSDIASQLSGSVGLGGSANIGTDHAMFEAIHGSAPDIAGQNVANPSGLINASVMMLMNLKQGKAATEIRNAWLKTLEEGMHTTDLYKIGSGSHLVGTKEFGDEVIKRLGQKPNHFLPADLKEENIRIERNRPAPTKKELTGVDIFIHHPPNDLTPNELGTELSKIKTDELELKLVANRGGKVYPDVEEGNFCTDHWICRYVSSKPAINNSDVIELMKKVDEAGFDIIQTENLYNFDGERGYSLAQGE